MNNEDCATACSSGKSMPDNEKDEIPGFKGEKMFVNTDSFEECTHDLNSQYNRQLVGSIVNKCPCENQTFKEENNLALNLDLPNTIAKKEDPENLQAFGNLSIISSEDANSLCSEDDQEYLQNSLWLSQEKHIFILSESGKPIYTRHGKEDRLVALFGLMQALVSVVADNDDIIRCITAGGHKFVFLVKSPLILVAVSHSTASVPQLLMQLTYVHSQIVSVLTASALTKMFEKRRNYDFRNMLGGTERLLDKLLDFLDYHPSFLLGAIQCMPLSNSVRETITQAIVQYCNKIKNLVFGLIICQNQLISLVRMRKFLLHPADLHLIFNLVSATESLKASENWIPICLPKFDSKGFLHGHVSYLAEDCEACLILLSVDREQFYTLSEAKKKIVDKLRRQHCLEKINQSVRSSAYSVQALESPELRHFLYKSKSTAQFTCPVYSPPYNLEKSRNRLFGLYQLLHHRVHSVARPLKMIYLVTETESLVGWVTKDFELYAVMDPIVTKSNAVFCVNKILQWIKNEENRLFILNSPTF